MNFFLYDGTFEGFLSAIFYAYEYKIRPDKIFDKHIFQYNLFFNKHIITTQPKQAERVLKGLLKKTSKRTSQEIYRVFLSEMEEAGMLLLPAAGGEKCSNGDNGVGDD